MDHEYFYNINGSSGKGAFVHRLFNNIYKRDILLVSSSSLEKSILSNNSLSIRQLFLPFIDPSSTTPTADTPSARQSSKGKLHLQIREVKKKSSKAFDDEDDEDLMKSISSQAQSKGGAALVGAQHPVAVISDQKQQQQSTSSLKMQEKRIEKMLNDVHDVNGIFDIDSPRDVYQLRAFMHHLAKGNHNDPFPWYSESRNDIYSYPRYSAEFDEFANIYSVPLAVLFVTSSADSDVVESFKKMDDSYNFPKVFQSGQSSLDPKSLPRFYFIAHDASDERCKGKNVETIKNQVMHLISNSQDHCNERVFCLTMNSYDGKQDNPHPDIWKDFIEFKSKRSSFAVGAAADTANVVKYGRMMTADDISSIQEAFNVIISKRLIGDIESRIQSLNNFISTNRKGLKNVLSSWLRPSKATGSIAYSGSTSSSQQQQQDFSWLGIIYYPFDSIEAHIQSLADLAFTVQDYDLALQMYKMIRDDYKSDKAGIQVAFSLEMVMVCTFLVGGSHSSVMEYFDEMYEFYQTNLKTIEDQYRRNRSKALNIPILPVREGGDPLITCRFQTRITLLLLDIVRTGHCGSVTSLLTSNNNSGASGKSQGLSASGTSAVYSSLFGGSFGNTSPFTFALSHVLQALLKSTSGESNLVSALMLEQAAYCVLDFGISKIAHTSSMQKTRPHESNVFLSTQYSGMIRKWTKYLVLAGSLYMDTLASLRCFKIAHSFMSISSPNWSHAMDFLDVKLSTWAIKVSNHKQSANHLSSSFARGTLATEPLCKELVKRYKEIPVVDPTAMNLFIRDGFPVIKDQQISLRLQTHAFETYNVVEPIGNDIRTVTKSDIETLHNLHQQFIKLNQTGGFNKMQPASQEPVIMSCFTKEPVIVSIGMKNPLDCLLEMTNIQLVVIASENRNEIETEIVPRLSIHPKGDIVVNLRFIPPIQGDYFVIGMRWKIGNMVKTHQFNIIGQLLHDTKHHRASRTRKMDSRTHLRTHNETSWLGIQWSNDSVDDDLDVIPGQIIKKSITLTNYGSEKCSSPIHVVFNENIANIWIINSNNNQEVLVEPCDDFGHVYEIPISLNPSESLVFHVKIRVASTNMLLRLCVGIVYSVAATAHASKGTHSTQLNKWAYSTISYAVNPMKTPLSVAHVCVANHMDTESYLLDLQYKINLPNIKIKRIVAVSNDWKVDHVEKPAHSGHSFRIKLLPDALESIQPRCQTFFSLTDNTKTETWNADEMLHFLALEHTSRIQQDRAEAKKEYEKLRAHLERLGKLPVTIQDVRRMAQGVGGSDPLAGIDKGERAEGEPLSATIASLLWNNDNIVHNQKRRDFHLCIQWEMVMDQEGKLVRHGQYNIMRRQIANPQESIRVSLVYQPYIKTDLPRSSGFASCNVTVNLRRIPSPNKQMKNEKPLQIDFEVGQKIVNNQIFSEWKYPHAWLGETKKIFKPIYPDQSMKLHLVAYFRYPGVYNLNQFAISIKPFANQSINETTMIGIKTPYLVAVEDFFGEPLSPRSSIILPITSNDLYTRRMSDISLRNEVKEPAVNEEIPLNDIEKHRVEEEEEVVQQVFTVEQGDVVDLQDNETDANIIPSLEQPDENLQVQQESDVAPIMTTSSTSSTSTSDDDYSLLFNNKIDEINVSTEKNDQDKKLQPYSSSFDRMLQEIDTITKDSQVSSAASSISQTVNEIEKPITSNDNNNKSEGNDGEGDDDDEFIKNLEKDLGA